MGGFLSHLKPEKSSETLYASCGPIRGNVYAHMKEQLNLTFEENTCLTLNVFAPRSTLKSVPVMVNIFGGGFEMGTSAVYDDYSISGTLPLKDVVVVTINYRVGVFGFFTTGDEVCRGNLALWDQTLALQWVQKHIGSFGGDPDNVTVFGCSAGAICADLLTLSPYSRDLFHKCIAMSGTANCEMACRSKESQAGIFLEFAKANGFLGSGKVPLSDSIQLFHWYRLQPPEVLKTISTFKFSASGFMSCAPNLDGDFFPKPLEDLRKEAPRKVFMIGGTEYEGLIMAIDDPVYSRIGNSIEVAGKKLFGSDVVEDPDKVLEILKESYQDRKGFIEFLGDTVFNIGILNAVESATKCGNDVYLYSFDYCNPEGYGALGSLLDFKASSHGSDFRYVLGDGGMEKFSPNAEELEVMEWMATTFTDFVKFGKPHIAWKKYNLEHPDEYFKIDFPTSRMTSNYQNGRLEILKKIQRKLLI